MNKTTTPERGTVLIMGTPTFIEKIIDVLDAQYDIENSTFLKLTDEGYYSRYLDLQENTHQP